MTMKEIIADRIADVERKLKARAPNGVPIAGYERNVEAIQTTLTELRRILALAEEQENV